MTSPPAFQAYSTIEALEDPEYEALPPNAGPVAHMIAGALAGITEHTVMYPVDAIKTRLQILVPGAPQAQYTGTAHAFSRISSTEGVRALWRGVSSVIIGAGPAHALYFASYEYCKAAALRMSGGPPNAPIAAKWAGMFPCHSSL
jgi:solute carrier family 25 iron transporter 28/37